MNPTVRGFSHLGIIGLALVGALWFPLPLYLLALALFGLPHVIWEIGFLRSRYGARWHRTWWIALWSVLITQALFRGATWSGGYASGTAQIIDMLALLIIGLIVAAAPRGTGWRARAAGLAIALGVWFLLEQGEVLYALLVLSLLHNFTPVAMAWEMARNARENPQIRALACTISGLMTLPLLVAFSGWEGAHSFPGMAAQSSLLEAQWPVAWIAGHRSAVLSAIVLAQCLHYYCVIVLLPSVESTRTGRPVLSARARQVAWIMTALMGGYFLIDYTEARLLYAIAAGLHAWLEWPVLLMAWLSGYPATDRKGGAG